MNTHTDKTQQNKSQSGAREHTQKKHPAEAAFPFADNRYESIAQRKLQAVMNNSAIIQQFRAYREMANNNPQLKQLKAIQEKAKHYTSKTAPVHPSFYSSDSIVQRKAAVKSLSVEWDKPKRPGFDIVTRAAFYNSGGYTAEHADVYQYTTGEHKEWKPSADRQRWELVRASQNPGRWENWSRANAPNSYQDNEAIIIDRSGFDNNVIPNGHFLEWSITARQSVHDRSEGGVEIAFIEAQTGVIKGQVPVKPEDKIAPAEKKGTITREPLLGVGLPNPWETD